MQSTADIPRVLPCPVIPTSTLPGRKRGKWHSLSAKSVTNWSAFVIVPWLTLELFSRGCTHPVQYAALSRGGVQPLPTLEKCLTRKVSQCYGISPSHSTPEDLSRTLGSRPRVTVWWTSVCRCSSSSAMSRSLALM